MSAQRTDTGSYQIDTRAAPRYPRLDAEVPATVAMPVAWFGRRLLIPPRSTRDPWLKRSCRGYCGPSLRTSEDREDVKRDRDGWRSQAERLLLSHSPNSPPAVKTGWLRRLRGVGCEYLCGWPPGCSRHPNQSRRRLHPQERLQAAQPLKTKSRLARRSLEPSDQAKPVVNPTAQIWSTGKLEFSQNDLVRPQPAGQL
jgi:hypothetical protein